MSPRLKASTRTHHNQADAHYFPVLELLQPYNALGRLLSRVFLDSHTMLSSPSTPTLILTSTLLSVMSKQNP